MSSHINEEDKRVWKLDDSGVFWNEGHDDHGLLVSEKARKYAFVNEFDHNLALKDKTIALQFEVRLHNGLEYGGSYLKYLRTQHAGWKAKKFDNESPYSIMFGSDKCGSTNKVHFILKHKNLKNWKYVEHHLNNRSSVPSDKLTHVYTALLTLDNKLRLLVDDEEKKTANFLSSEDFEPPLIPAILISDPNDKKPEDWERGTEITRIVVHAEKMKKKKTKKKKTSNVLISFKRRGD
ncbi:Calreticulin/calnexin [Trema orientale]|uniref:Calreticulin/calnexin n=1 Tax=Trema orientale TaxID=63057 RepID=A0A2P5FDE9_TREOI|nr:Calreticulin/calnexin [Trema orientale]